MEMQSPACPRRRLPWQPVSWFPEPSKATADTRPGRAACVSDQRQCRPAGERGPDEGGDESLHRNSGGVLRREKRGRQAAREQQPEMPHRDPREDFFPGRRARASPQIGLSEKPPRREWALRSRPRQSGGEPGPGTCCAESAIRIAVGNSREDSRWIPDTRTAADATLRAPGCAGERDSGEKENRACESNRRERTQARNRYSPGATVQRPREHSARLRLPEFLFPPERRLCGNRRARQRWTASPAQRWRYREQSRLARLPRLRLRRDAQMDMRR